MATTYTVYEYDRVTPAGEPMEPPQVRTVAQAFGAALRLAAETVYVAVVPDADMRLRICPLSTDTAAATDHKILAGDCRGFPVQKRARPYLYGIAA